MKIDIDKLSRERAEVQVSLYKARQIKKEIDKMPDELRFDGSRNSIDKTYDALIHNLKGRLMMLNKLINYGSR